MQAAKAQERVYSTISQKENVAADSERQHSTTEKCMVLEEDQHV